MPRAQSIHVGVNEPRECFDARAESVPSVLQHSEKTAWRMAEVASRAGYDSILVLRGAEATCQAVEGALTAAAGALKDGDTLFVSFSGHGKRVRDQNGDERSGWDHAWCLHDGILLDDRLAERWTDFEPGVRIVVVAENCFGGGGMRGEDDPGFAGRGSAPPPEPTLGAQRNGATALRSPYGAETESWTPRGDEQAFGTPRGGDGQGFGIPRSGDGQGFGTPRGGDGQGFGTPRSGGQVFQTARTGTAEARAAEPCVKEASHETYGIRASLLLLAASCEERQPKDGLYAEHLLGVWNGGLFEGSYCDLHRRVSERVLSNGAPRPHISMLGVFDPDFQREPAFHRRRGVGAEGIAQRT